MFECIAKDYFIEEKTTIPSSIYAKLGKIDGVI